MLSRPPKEQGSLAGHQADVLAVHRPCHYAISSGRSVVWIARHTTCCFDPKTGRLIIDIAQDPRWLAALKGAANALASLPAGAIARIKRARTWIPELVFPQGNGWPWFPVLELSFSRSTRHQDCWPLARVRIYAKEPQVLKSALQSMAQCSAEPKGRSTLANIPGKPGVAAEAANRAAVLMPAQRPSPCRHGATCADHQGDISVTAGSSAGAAAWACCAWLTPHPKHVPPTKPPAIPSPAFTEPAADSDDSARPTTGSAGDDHPVDAPIRADSCGQPTALESSGVADAAKMAMPALPPSGPSTEEGAAKLGPKAAEAKTVTCVPIGDNADLPTLANGRPAEPLQPPALTEAGAARAGPNALMPSQQPSSVDAAAPVRARASVRGPLRPLQFPQSSMAAFAASPAPLPQPVHEPTGPGACGGRPGALPSEQERAAQGQVAHHPGARQDTFLPEGAVRFRPDLTSIRQTGRHASPVSERLPQHGELLDTARGTNGTYRQPAGDGAAAACRVHAAQAKQGPSTGAPSAVRMPSTATAPAQPCDVQRTQSKIAACNADGSAAAAYTKDAAMPSEEGVKRPARPLASPSAGTGQCAASLPGNAQVIAGVSPACRHAAADRTGQCSSVSGVLVDGGAALSPPDSTLPEASCKSLAGPQPLQPSEAVCVGGQPASAAGAAAAARAAVSPSPAIAKQAAEIKSHQAGQPASEPVSLTHAGRLRPSGIVASAITALGLGRTAMAEGEAQEAMSLKLPQARVEPRKAPQLCPQDFEAAWFCGRGRDDGVAGTAHKKEISTSIPSCSTPAAAAISATAAEEDGVCSTAEQAAEEAPGDASLPAPCDLAVQGLITKSAPGGEARTGVVTVNSPTPAMVAAPEVGEEHTLEEHNVAARVRAFERAASKLGAAAPQAPSSARRKRLSYVPCQ